MLDPGGDDVRTLDAAPHDDALDRVIVGFGATTGKDSVPGRRVQQRCNLGTRLLDNEARLAGARCHFTFAKSAAIRRPIRRIMCGDSLL